MLIFSGLQCRELPESSNDDKGRRPSRRGGKGGPTRARYDNRRDSVFVGQFHATRLRAHHKFVVPACSPLASLLNDTHSGSVSRIGQLMDYVPWMVLTRMFFHAYFTKISLKIFKLTD